MLSNTQSNGAEGNNEMPQHVKLYLNITRELDDVVRRVQKGGMNKEDIVEVKRKLEEFYGSLSDGDQEDLRIFTESVISGKLIEAERGKFHGAMTWALNVPQRVVKTAGEPILKFANETIILIGRALGMLPINGVAAVIGGVRSAIDSNLRNRNAGRSPSHSFAAV
ncbi:hypothetical protein HOF56_00160 [Candidatus Peribacteria bacterium]|jgi:hypothetical protein|nr:hypothetical protein [Candidatus Peribacteria bacterium]MBT4020970.1 hypothetical protein [Candidatus Peribacteria bacterium]MBT4240320.1 hypothetical protein [Candidatus Peribacteria bacterium]MBT4474082.1 hypothetical protein [Candidatus Peribacteria bacterium]